MAESRDGRQIPDKGGVLKMLSRSFGCRLSDEYQWRGLRLLVLENEALRVCVLLDKGADIVELRYKPRDVDFLWHSETPLVWTAADRQSVTIDEGPFTDYYEGCWQEILPNAGRWCSYEGAEFGLHGEVWGLPWVCRVLEDSPEAVAVELSVRCRRMPLKLTRMMRLERGKPALFLEEKLANDSPVEVACMWGHHPAYGEPFLGPACRIHCPPCTVVVGGGAEDTSRVAADQGFTWPTGRGRKGEAVDISRIAPRQARLDEMYYLADLAAPWYALANEDLGLTVGMAWGGAAFRCVWYWASLCGARGWPSWGRDYVVALEPMSSYPAILTNAIAEGTELRLAPGQVIEERLTACVGEKGAAGGVGLDGEIS